MSQPSSQWFLPGEDDQNDGPYSAAEITARLQSGALDPSTECWREGMNEWQPLSELPEFRNAMTAGLGRRRRSMVDALVSVLFIVAVLIGGVIAFLVTREPPELRDGRNSLKAGDYAEAARRLLPYVNEHPEDHLAGCLLAAALLGNYASLDGPSYDDKQLRAADELFARCFAAQPQLRDEARPFLADVADRVPARAPDCMARLLAVGRLRQKLGAADANQLAKESLAKATAVGAERLQQQMNAETVAQILSWRPAAGGEIARLLLPPLTKTSPFEQENAARVFLQGAKNFPEAGAALAACMLERAALHATAGQFDLAESALALAESAAPNQWDKIARQWMDCLRKRLAAGDADAAWRSLERVAPRMPALKNDVAALYLDLAKQVAQTSPGRARELLNKVHTLEPGYGPLIAAVYLDIAKRLFPADRRGARDAMNHALELQPSAKNSEDVCFLAIRLADPLDETKRSLCRSFTASFPNSTHRPEVLLVVVDDALRAAERSGGMDREQVKAWLRDGWTAASEGLKQHAANADWQDKIYNLAKATWRWAHRGDEELDSDASQQAVTLLDSLLASAPGAARRSEFESERKLWRAWKDPTIKELRSLCRSLAGSPPDRQSLVALREMLARAQTVEAQEWYLAVDYVANCYLGDTRQAAASLGALQQRYPSSRYLPRVAADQLMENCPTCHGTRSTKEQCAQCKGSGRCNACGGRGYIPGIRSNTFCPKCHRTGRCQACVNGAPTKPCTACRGAGKQGSLSKMNSLYRELLASGPGA
jgi:hypothetical protein